MAAKTSASVIAGWLTFRSSDAFNKVTVQLTSANVGIGEYSIPVALGQILLDGDQIALTLDMDITLMSPKVKRRK